MPQKNLIRPEVRLGQFEELIDWYAGIAEHPYDLEIVFEHHRISWPKSSKSGEIARSFFQDLKPGTLVGILRSDSADQPLLLRKIEEGVQG